MTNMSYCKFRNTIKDVEDCIDSLNNSEISSEEEKAAAKSLVALILDFAKQEYIIDSYDAKQLHSIIDSCE